MLKKKKRKKVALYGMIPFILLKKKKAKAGKCFQNAVLFRRKWRYHWIFAYSHLCQHTQEAGNWGPQVHEWEEDIFVTVYFNVLL